MANLNTPFLSNPNSDTSSDPSQLEDQALPSLDSTIDYFIGEFGWDQLVQAILISFARFFDAQQSFITVFADADPAWHCESRLSNSSCSSGSDICHLPRQVWAWDLPEHASTVSEWDLECLGSFLIGLPASSFFMGCVLGGLLFGALGDSCLGRKKMLFFSCLAMALSTLGAAASPNIWIYSALRFVAGLGRATIGTSVIVLSTELVGQRLRGNVSVMGFVCFTLGFLSLPAIAYVNHGSSWRNLYLWTSIPTILYSFAVHFFALESPRWLLIRGRKDDAVETLRSIGSNLGSKREITSSLNIPFEQERTENLSLYSAMKILIDKNWAFRRLSTLMVVGFGIGMVDYGMPLALGNLDFSLYLSFTLNALAELVASFVTYYILGRMNRRSSILSFSLVSGFCSLMCVVKLGEIWTRLAIGFELVSYFSARVAYIMLLNFTVELFPTCVRNSAVSLVSKSLVFSAVVGSMVAAAGRGDGFLSFGVFGLAIGCLGFFVLYLPETKGNGICDTMDEEIKNKDDDHDLPVARES